MESSPEPWIQALRHSHDALRDSVESLDAEQLAGPSYCTDWSIGQVMSHLGSGAEIFTLFIDAGLGGKEPPGRDAFPAIWDSWNAKSPSQQTADALVSDNDLVQRLVSLDAEELEGLRLQMFGRDFDTAGLARMRLGEHTMHSWDIAVMREPNATLAPESVGLLIDTLDQLVGRFGKEGEQGTRLDVTVTSPDRHFVLQTGENASLTEADGEGGLPTLVLPAEAFLRLLYGRLDPAHTPAVQTSGVDLDELRAAFPGF